MMTARQDQTPVVVNCLAEVRCALGFTQTDLGARVGVSRESISNIERGLHVPALWLALEIARVFGMAVEEIFELRR